MPSGRIQKFILRNGLSLGDVVMLTAAVRDLHRRYPGKFLTDVRTSCMEVWEHNPHISTLAERDPSVRILECTYPLINRANVAPYHCLHGFIDFLNDELGLEIVPTEFRGDIHLSKQEKAWYSQVHEATGEDTPFWIIAAGGKYDISIKWWNSARYQKVVDYFRGKIQFVQVGAYGHFHPRLEGVIDFRGQTDIRELIRLVYHSQGVLCGVTSVMHLAAAVEVKWPGLKNRPCVVIAGGREPIHWEAYPHHQFIHTAGALPCCAQGGCWKDRVSPLRDSDPRDESLCVDVAGTLPRCMDMITPEEVIRRIEIYYAGGMLEYLSPRQARAARRGVFRTRENEYDCQPLCLHNAGMALDAFLPTIPPYPGGFSGRGIVICGGGAQYFVGAWVSIRMLRALGCRLPIQLWHMGEEELNSEMEELVAPYGVECVDALRVRKEHPMRALHGWELKPFAILYAPYAEVLYLDADNVPVRDPVYLFDAKDYQKTGAVFWPDYGRLGKSDPIWRSCGLERPPGLEFESGQILVDKRRAWAALRLALWFNEHSDFYYQHIHGDKETFHLAFAKLGQPFAFVPHPIHRLDGTMCQHDFEGKRVFQHRNTDKWNLFLRNRTVDDFWREAQCQRFVRELRDKWDGRASLYLRKLSRAERWRARAPRILACIITCRERKAMLLQTVGRLARTDFGEEPLIQIDEEKFDCKKERQSDTARLALTGALRHRPDFILYLEDDLAFNAHLRHNLLRWLPLRRGAITLAGIYNPGLRHVACDVANHCFVVKPESVFGSQALLLSAEAARFACRHWEEVGGMQDIKLSRLAGRLGSPLFYHSPSLVQHVGRRSSWGGQFHQAFDFDPDWKA